MKKTLGAVVALALAAAVVHGATEVKSVNVVGFTKVNIKPGAFSLIGFNFNSLDAQGQTLRGVLGSGLYADDFPFNADNLYVYDTGSSVYKNYYQRSDGLFYDADKFTFSDPGPATNPVVAVGEGMFVAGSLNVGAHDLSLMGEVVSASNQTVDVVNNFQILSFPFSQAIDIQETSFGAMSGASLSVFPFNADNIYMLTPSGSYANYYLGADGKWRDVNDWSFSNQNPAPVVGVQVQLGQSFFYQALNPSLWSWAETNKYISSL